MRTVVEELSREFFAPFMLKLAAKKHRRTVAKKIGEGVGVRTCSEPREKSCSVDMTVKWTGPKSNPYQGESANGSLAGPGMMNLAQMVAVLTSQRKHVKHRSVPNRPPPMIGRPRRLHVKQERMRIELTQTSSVKWLKSACPLLPS